MLSFRVHSDVDVMVGLSLVMDEIRSLRDLLSSLAEEGGDHRKIPLWSDAFFFQGLVIVLVGLDHLV